MGLKSFLTTAVLCLNVNSYDHRNHRIFENQKNNIIVLIFLSKESTLLSQNNILVISVSYDLKNSKLYCG